MNIEYKEIQKRIQKNPELIDDNKTLKGLISDYWSKYEIIKNISCTLVDAGIVKEMVKLKNIDSLTFSRYAKYMESNYGISSSAVLDCIKLWSDIFKIEFEIAEKLINFDELRKNASIMRRRYQYGYIDFFLCGLGAVITDLRINYSKGYYGSYVTIPEELGDKPVFGIAKNAFEALEDARYIVIPSTVQTIENGAVSELNCRGDERILYFAEKEYSKYVRGKLAYVNDYWSFFNWFPNKDKLLLLEETYDGYIKIPASVICHNDWQRPQSDFWVYNNRLYRYTGNKKKLYVDAEYVENSALYKCKAEEIIFSDRVKNIAFRAIDHCTKLIKIAFEASECHFERLMAYNCPNLETIKWPAAVQFSGNVISDCPKMPVVIVNNILAHYSIDDSTLDIQIEEGVQEIAAHAIEKKTWKRVIFPVSLKKFHSQVIMYGMNKSFEQTFVFKGKSIEWPIGKNEIALRQFAPKLNIYISNPKHLEEYIKSIPGDIGIEVFDIDLYQEIM